MNQISVALATFAEKAYKNHDSAHNLAHAYAVYNNARELVALEHIELTPYESCLFAPVILLHDARDHKLVASGSCLDQSEINTFLDNEYGRDARLAIIKIHENCSWSNRKTSLECDPKILRKILQDADWLEAIGATGIQRCIDYTRNVNSTLTDSEVKRIVCAHIREKLLLIRDELNYESSRKKASADTALTRYLRDNEIAHEI